MRRRDFTTFWRDEQAAIAPLYALALFGLIGIAGVGWDYGRMMTMKSELQNAADHAALAAATQLDGQEGAMDRARAAVTGYLANADGEWVNRTRNSNDGQGTAITVTNPDTQITFYVSYDGDTDTFGDVAATDDDAAVVRVVVDSRELFFALTPVVDAFSSGQLAADAVAGLETSTCNVPPLMFCVPDGDTSFPGAGDIGRGVEMHWHDGGNSAWVPGNFGFLDIDYDIPNNLQNKTTGLNSEFLGCAGNDVMTRPGDRQVEMSAFNTRFDMFPNGNSISCGDPGSGDFCPSQNTQKNRVVEVSLNGNSTSDPSTWICPSTPPNNYSWIDPASTSGANQPATNVGFPKDSSMGSDGFGNGEWNLSDFMAANHPGVTMNTQSADLDGNGSISRYEAYQWELEDVSGRLVNGTRVGASWNEGTTGGGKGGGGVTQYSNRKLYCAYPQPISETPVVPSSNQKDRRIITVAAVNCSGMSGGRAEADILRWVDLFLVQPESDDAGDHSFFAEIIGEADPPGADDSAFQAYGKNKPVLLR